MKTYKKYKQEGLCIRCGDVLDDKSKSYCKSCLEKNRLSKLSSLNGCDWYDCNTCPHEDCIADVDRAQRNRDAINNRNKIYHHKKYKESLESGLCSVCHKNIPKSGKKICEQCLERKKLSSKKYYYSHHIIKINKDEYKCRFCNEPVIEGKKTCIKHYKQYSEKMNIVNEINRKRREKCLLLLFYIVSKRRN